MGFLKNNANRLHVLDKSICESCLDDNALKNHVRGNLIETQCSYCGAESESPIATPVDGVMRIIQDGIESEWTDPANELPYDGREGGYQGEVIATTDLRYELEICDNDEFWKDLVSFLETEYWCRKNYFGVTKDEVLLYSWGRFSELTKHNTRYFFLRTPKPPRGEQIFGPYDTLFQIGVAIKEVGLISKIPVGTKFFRARVHDPTTNVQDAKNLGPPVLAKYSNRMSPSGISMFYGAMDSHTAYQEVAPTTLIPMKNITIGTFLTLRPLTLINLSQTPSIPSLFDIENLPLRSSVKFLREFTANVSKPIQKDGFEHIEYVPTQIITEYFRMLFPRQHGLPVEGLLYPSAKNKDGTCIALFCTNEHCCDQMSSRDGNKYILQLSKCDTVEPWRGPRFV